MAAAKMMCFWAVVLIVDERGCGMQIELTTEHTKKITEGSPLVCAVGWRDAPPLFG